MVAHGCRWSRGSFIRPGDEEFDWEGDGEADDAAAAADGDEDDDEIRHAKGWDTFLRYVHSVRPFDDDSDSYVEKRAVECFNAVGPMCKWYKELKPNAQSACPHVAQSVVPRQVGIAQPPTQPAAHAMLCLPLHPSSPLPPQMRWRGDPTRRGADHGESLGALIKDGLHRRTLRRRKAEKATTHKKRDAAGNVIKTWTQRPLAVSRVMQVWRDMAVREKMLRDEASTDYLLRKHFTAATTGFGQVKPESAPKGPPPSVAAKLKEARDNA